MDRILAVLLVAEICFTVGYRLPSPKSSKLSIFAVSSTKERKATPPVNDYDGTGWDENISDAWKDNQGGFDWELEKARRFLEGPSFAPLRMTLWQPNPREIRKGEFHPSFIGG